MLVVDIILRFDGLAVDLDHGLKMDRLRNSIAIVDAPACPNCQLSMRWFQSTLVSDQPATVSHMFICPHCNRFSTIKAIAVREAPEGMPGKMSAPSSRSGHSVTQIRRKQMNVFQ
jgi:hypothetical protein